MRQESDVYCDKAQCRLATRTAQQSDISMEQEVRLPRTWCGGVQLTSSNDDCCTAASVAMMAVEGLALKKRVPEVYWEQDIQLT